MKKNFKYAKLTENGIEYAPNILIIGNTQKFNAPAEDYALLGWLPVNRTTQLEADDGYYFTPYYEEESGKIVRLWNKEEIPEQEETTE